MGISVIGMMLLAGALAVARPALAQTPGSSAAPGSPGPPPPEAGWSPGTKTPDAALPEAKTPDPGLPAATASDTALPAKRPDIRLVGVILEEGRAPVALIETPRTRHQALYRVGDEVGEARIEQILQDRAIVRYQGQAVELRLAGSPTASTPTAPAPATGAASAAERPDPAVAARLLELARRLRDNPNDTEASEELRRLRAERLPPRVNARDLAQSSAEPDVASALPVEGGVRLTEVSEGGVLAGLGLRPGDIVRSVNQRPVGPQRSLGQALAEAAAPGSERLRIEIMRDGAQTIQEQPLAR